MATMGNYCKAYYIRDLRNFPGWQDQEPSIETNSSGPAQDNPTEQATDTAEEYAFLQENYVVTKGIFKDEEILWDKVTPEWEQFCKETLQFAVPPDALPVEHRYGLALPVIRVPAFRSL